MITPATNPTIPAISHFLWVLLKCSKSFQLLFRQAHRLPFSPRIIHITKPAYGMTVKKEIHVLLNIPQNHPKTKPPQLHFLTSLSKLTSSILYTSVTHVKCHPNRIVLPLTPKIYPDSMSWLVSSLVQLLALRSLDYVDGGEAGRTTSI